MDDSQLLDQLHEVSRQLGAEINVETAHWERQQGQRSVTVDNQRVTLVWPRNGRRVLLVYQSEPQPPDLPGVELLVTDKKQKFDLRAERRSGLAVFASWFSGGKLKPVSESLASKWLFRCGAADQRESARMYLEHGALDAAFQPFEVGELWKLEFQEGVGLSAYYRPVVAPRLQQPWIEANADSVARLLAIACA